MFKSINREYNGKNINDNIRLIGACNPYRRRKDNIKKWGLSLTNDNDNDLVYLVQPFPQSLLYYVFSFGSIDVDDEKKYIHSILYKSFSKEEKYLHETTTEAISECHKYLREIYDPSVVSLREIARFSKCIEFFKDYFKIKNESIVENNEMDNKLRSIICSIYLCYYIRLTNQDTRQAFENKLKSILLKLINIDGNNDVNNLIKQIDNERLKEEIIKINEKIKREQIKKFSEFLEIEQDYILVRVLVQN